MVATGSVRCLEDLARVEDLGAREDEALRNDARRVDVDGLLLAHGVIMCSVCTEMDFSG